jgi:hypothetical protein
MKQLLSWLIVMAIAIGALLLRFSFVNGGEANWVPVTMSFPSRGFSVGAQFAQSTGGWFAVNVITLAGADERKLPSREGPPIACDLRVVVKGPDGFTLQRSIKQLQVCGWTYETTIYCPSEQFLLPSGGNYAISMFNRSPSALFSDRGALVQLTRFEPPGHELLYSFARFLSYGSFLFAGIGTLFIAYRRQR